MVEPSGFTKISTLGVEEQRVNVIVDFVDPPEDRATLGDGFRVEARIVIDEAKDVLKVPTSAPVPRRRKSAVFRVVDQHGASSRFVQVGRQNGLEAEVARRACRPATRSSCIPATKSTTASSVRQR